MKKQRISKKLLKQQQLELEQQQLIKQQELEQQELIKQQQIKQQDIYLSIDVGLIKLGYCVMQKDFKLLELNDINLKSYQDKRSMVEFQQNILQNLNKLLDDLMSKYKINKIIVEQQIGAYSAKQIELCIQQYFIIKYPDLLYQLQMPTLKLKCQICQQNKQQFDQNKRKYDTKKYNQNKNQAVDSANIWLKQNNYEQIKSRDQADALLQILYYIENDQN